MRLLKKIIYIALTMITGYFAGIYRTEGLMILFTAEVIFFFLMLAEAFIASRTLSIEAEQNQRNVTIGDHADLAFTLQSKGVIPGAGYSLLFEVLEPGSEKKTLQVNGFCRGRRKSLQLGTTAAHCGLIHAKIASAGTCDRMGFFYFPIRQSGSADLAIWPKAKVLPLPEDLLRSSRKPDPGATPDPGSDDTPDEVKDIREYREGDSFKRIHWNMSARTDELWVREYQSDIAHQSVTICADRTGLPPAGDLRDRWYLLLTGLIRACIVNENPVYLYPAPGDSTPGARRKLRREDDIPGLLLALYAEAEEGRIPDVPAVPQDPAEYRVDSDLALYQGGELIGSFADSEIEG